MPAAGFSSPAATLSSVDFPQPVGPTMATNSPCCDGQPGLLDRRIDARIGQAKRHRRVVKRDRRWLLPIIHRDPPEVWNDALAASRR